MLDLKDMGNISEGLWIAQRETPDLPGWSMFFGGFIQECDNFVGFQWEIIR